MIHKLRQVIFAILLHFLPIFCKVWQNLQSQSFCRNSQILAIIWCFFSRGINATSWVRFSPENKLFVSCRFFFCLANHFLHTWISMFPKMQQPCFELFFCPKILSCGPKHTPMLQNEKNSQRRLQFSKSAPSRNVNLGSIFLEFSQRPPIPPSCIPGSIAGSAFLSYIFPLHT